MPWDPHVRAPFLGGGGPAPEGMLSYCTWAQEAISTKRRKKFGSAVAYKTISTVVSQEGHGDASGPPGGDYNRS